MKIQTFTSAPLPPYVKRLNGNCFDMTILSAMKHPKLNYVEGFAKVRGDNRWLYHAWLTDGVNAYDIVWRAEDKKGKTQHIPPQYIKYIGIVLKTKPVADFVIKTEYQGVLANCWRNLLLAIKCL